MKTLITLVLIFVCCAPLAASAQNSTPQRTPTETVREFYKAMRERRFREAFSMTVYKPAVEALSQEEFEDLRPDFENMATAIPEKMQLTGEQTNGDIATVFVVLPASDGQTAKPEPATLILSGGEWIVGDKDTQNLVRASGKKFFFDARIEANHIGVQELLTRISLAQLVYSQQHNGQFGDLAALLAAGLIPKEVGTGETGYRFHITLTSGAKSWTVQSEPVRYGHTGRLSFFMDKSGVKSEDTGGKPLTPSPSHK
jgi:hypothetical protein